MSTTSPATPTETETAGGHAVASIITTARSTEVPHNWWVWQLQRGYVAQSALKWGALGILGFVLFIPALFIMLPVDFKGLLFIEIFATVILVFLGAMAFGGIGIAMYDLWRLTRATEFLVIMTPEDFIKVEPGRVTHVPMSEVSRVTVKGVKPPDVPAASSSGSGGRLYGEMHGSSLMRMGDSLDNMIMRKNARGPRSLAFLDLRSQREILVSTDESFGSLLDLEQALNMYATGVEIIRQ